MSQVVAEPAAFDWVANGATSGLGNFLAAAPVLSTEQRLLLIDQAILLLHNYYVHLPEKRARHSIDPLADLAALRKRRDDIAEREFHQALCDIFATLRDLHTQYSLPAFYRSGVALLPFKLGAYVAGRDQKPTVIVTQRLASYPWRPDQNGFDRGTEILTWGGQPIAAVIAAMAGRSGGASAAAGQARALANLTLWPMERQPPPAAEMVELTYRAAAQGGRQGAAGQGAAGQGAAGQGAAGQGGTGQGGTGLGGTGATSFAYVVAPAPLAAAVAAETRRYISLDHENEARRHASKHAWHPAVEDAERQARTGMHAAPYRALVTRLPSILEARPFLDRFGYLRIHSFNPAVDDGIEALIALFVEECARLVGLLPKQGLVLDVRGNGGGYLPLAESLTQLFTPHCVTPQSLQMLATSAAPELARNLADLTAYLPSLEQAVTQAGGAPAGGTAAGYSAAFPLTLPAWCNQYGQVYHGPVVLLVDARCYSATDAFAAAFQDHGCGPVLGVSPGSAGANPGGATTGGATTGGGGGNVWTAADFPPGTGLDQALPCGAGLRVALRRTRRVAPREGMLVEEVGVAADHVHATTLADLLDDDVDLLARAATLLDARAWYQLDADMVDGGLVLTTRGIESVRITCGELMWSLDLAGDGPARLPMPALLPPASPTPAWPVTVRGFANGGLVAARRIFPRG